MNFKKVAKGYKSRIEWVPVRKLEVKEGYQAPLNPAHAAKIAAEFDPDLLGYPVVVAIEGRAGGEHFYIIDGQHRINAVRIALGDDQLVECEVVRGVDLTCAAQLFLGRNAGRPKRVIDKFLVGVKADESEPVAIDAIVRAAGLSVGRNASATAITCVSTLRRLYRMGTEGAVVRETLDLAGRAWGNAADTWNGDVLLGLGLVLNHHNGALDRGALERALRTRHGGALGVLGQARALREALGTSIGDAAAHAIVRTYNKGRTTRRLPTWGEKAA